MDKEQFKLKCLLAEIHGCFEAWIGISENNDFIFPKNGTLPEYVQEQMKEYHSKISTILNFNQNKIDINQSSEPSQNQTKK